MTGTEKSSKAVEVLTLIAVLWAIAALVNLIPKPEQEEISEPNDPPAVSRAVYKRMRVTAYCPHECCCGDFADGVTASGVPAVGLIIAADTRLFPFGTEMDVPGYGQASVQDVGGAIKGDRLDVLFATHQEALNWGVRYLEVRML